MRIKQFEYDQPTLQDCLNSLIKFFEGTKALLRAWSFHRTIQISWHLGTMLLSNFRMWNRKYASTILITEGVIFARCCFLR